MSKETKRLISSRLLTPIDNMLDKMEYASCWLLRKPLYAAPIENGNSGHKNSPNLCATPANFALIPLSAMRCDAANTLSLESPFEKSSNLIACAKTGCEVFEYAN